MSLERPDGSTIAGLAERLKRRIRGGVYAPGQRLVEADLVQELGVGRGRVRETLKTLVGEGYLEFEENRGVRVKRLSRREAADIGRAREALEGLAARLAAEKPLTPPERSTLADIQAGLDRATTASDLEAYAQLNVDLHGFIVEAADNVYVAGFLERLRAPMVRLQFRSAFTLADLGRRNDAHRLITAAILAGDGDAAEAAMRDHVRLGNSVLTTLADDSFD
jgi:DNA-binding GntR family transcriptional regulator